MKSRMGITARAGGILLLVSFLIGSCDLSALLEQEAEPAGTEFQITGMRFTTADNPILTQDISASAVIGTKIFVEIPFAVKEDASELIPRFDSNGLVNEDGQPIPLQNGDNSICTLPRAHEWQPMKWLPHWIPTD
jgi:hypothetical protein